MSTRLLIAYALIALALLAFAMVARQASRRRRRPRSSREHLRVDLFAADGPGSGAPDADVRSKPASAAP